MLKLESVMNLPEEELPVGFITLSDYDGSWIRKQEDGTWEPYAEIALDDIDESEGEVLELLNQMNLDLQNERESHLLSHVKIQKQASEIERLQAELKAQTGVEEEK